MNSNWKNALWFSVVEGDSEVEAMTRPGPWEKVGANRNELGFAERTTSADGRQWSVGPFLIHYTGPEPKSELKSKRERRRRYKWRSGNRVVQYNRREQKAFSANDMDKPSSTPHGWNDNRVFRCTDHYDTESSVRSLN